MYKFLYDSFAERWYREGGTIYFYSDPHFADEEMVHLRKNYIGDEEQVKSINRICGKKDTLIILGDVGDIEYVKRLRAAYKVLIMGNHDVGASKYRGVFDEVYEGMVFISPKLVLSHEPVNVPFAFNIHGHDHSGELAGPTHMNLCAERTGYKPLSLKAICTSGFLKNIPDIHRAAIDKASHRTE